ncbi:MAG: carbohydrate ABC transporter permease [Clostridia bacterium]|nr:carbohydrate ABC transporter permease [Clostridia bacterium]
MKIKTEGSTIAFNIIGYMVVFIFALFCLLPFWAILSSSLSSEKSVLRYGASLIPREFSTSAYEFIFKSPRKIMNAYGVSTMVTVSGTLLGLFLISMTAYVLYRKDFKYRNAFAFGFYFTQLFSGGLIPFYILVVQYLQLKNNYLALILPPLMNAWYIILFRNFLNSVPDSLVESAKIDGAGDFRIYAQIILPLSTPGLATVGLFLALGYWNDWYHALLFINTRDMFPLQFLLYEVLRSAEYIAKILSQTGAVISTGNLPTETVKMATAMVVTGPIILLYPIIQKYYVKGLTIGAVKG